VDGTSTEIPYADLGPGKVQIEFKRLDAAVFPDEPEAGDEDDEDDDDDDDDEEDDEDGEGGDR
jgi:ribosome maturation factor RimP